MGMVTAIHEAGHAWAYRLHRKPLRYVTIRPREAMLAGVCRPWKPRKLDIGIGAFIASAGPVAEAMFSQPTEAEADLFTWDDHLSGAVLAGGHGDLELSLGMLDCAEAIALIREQMRNDWAGITRLAESLLEDRTLDGKRAFELLGTAK